MSYIGASSLGEADSEVVDKVAEKAAEGAIDAFFSWVGKAAEKLMGGSPDEKRPAARASSKRKSGREALDRAKEQKAEAEARKAAYKLAVSQKASADAAAGKYDPPPTAGEPKPGGNPALEGKKRILLEYRKQYDSEWTAATGKPLPSSASMSSAGGRGEVPSSKFPVVPALAVAGVVAVLLLRRK